MVLAALASYVEQASLQLPEIHLPLLFNTGIKQVRYHTWLDLFICLFIHLRQDLILQRLALSMLGLQVCGIVPLSSPSVGSLDKSFII